MKKLIVLAFSLMLFSFTESDWKEVYRNSQVKIMSRQADCNLDNAFKQRWFLLSFHNPTTSTITVQWNVELYDENQQCVTCNDAYGEYKYSLTLKPGETLEGKCDMKCAPELRIVSKLLDVKTSMSYPDFKITDVKVSTAK